MTTRLLFDRSDDPLRGFIAARTQAELVADAEFTPTANYSDNRERVRVGPGPVGFLLNYTQGATTTLDILVEVSPLGDPSLSDALHWWTPADETGATTDTLSVAIAGQFFIDLSKRFPGTTTGSLIFTQITPTIRWVRVSVKTTSGGAQDATALIILLYHTDFPGGAGTGSVST